MTEFESPQATPRTVSAGALIGGMILAIFVGAIANIIAGLIAISAGNGFLGFLIGFAPGGLFILWGALMLRRSRGFAIGLLVGGCIIALIGGACGASMVGTSFH